MILFKAPTVMGTWAMAVFDIVQPIVMQTIPIPTDRPYRVTRGARLLERSSNGDIFVWIVVILFCGRRLLPLLLNYLLPPSLPPKFNGGCLSVP